jgi:hypothetical protein
VKCDVICCSPTPDQSGMEVRALLHAAQRSHARWLLVDWPTPTSQAHHFDDSKWSRLHRSDHVTSELGDRVARNRTLAVYSREPPAKIGTTKLPELEELLARSTRATGESWSHCMLAPDAISKELWLVDWTVKWDGRLSSPDPFLPKPAGSVVDPKVGNASKLLVLGPKGPLGTNRPHLHPICGYGSHVVQDTRGEGQGVRALEPLEVWNCCGHSAREWRARLDHGMTVDQLMLGAAQALPAHTAQVITGAAAQLLGEPPRAGAAYDQDQLDMEGALTRWLAAWKKNPDHPDTSHPGRKSRPARVREPSPRPLTWTPSP